MEIPVSSGRVGMVAAGGLDALAAVEEAGIRTGHRAVCTLLLFEQLRTCTQALGEFTWGETVGLGWREKRRGLERKRGRMTC